MKVALVALKVSDARKVPPLGLASLATYVKKANNFSDTVIVDGNYENIHASLRKLRPELIGLSAMSANYGTAIALAKEIREYSDAKIAVGGMHITSLPDSLNKVFDFGVIGEGEVTYSEIVSVLLDKGALEREDISEIAGLVYFDENGNLKQSAPRPLVPNLDDIPYPDLSYVKPDYFKPKDEVGLKIVAPCGPIFTARGCPYHCAFCSIALFWDRYRMNSAAYVVDNILYLVNNYNARVIEVLDDTFTVSKKRLKELLGLLEQSGLLGKVVFKCNARVNHIDEEMCELLSKLNVRQVKFGFESGSDRMLKYLKAGSVSASQNREAILMCKKYGFEVFGTLIFGSPGEKIEDMRETIDFIDFAKKQGVGSLWHFVASPLPGTKFWEEAKKRGRVSDDMNWEKSDSLFDLYDSYYNNAPLTDVPAEDFKRIFLEAKRKLTLMRLNIALKFFLSNPLGVSRQFLGNMTFYLRRIYQQMFRV